MLVSIIIQFIERMNSAFIKDHSTAFLASKGASLWPIEFPKSSVTSQVEHQLVSSLLSSASLPSSGFSHPKILLPFNSMMPLSGELMSSPEANRLQNLIANPLLRNSESLATNSLFGAKSCGLGGFGNYHRTAQAEAHSNDLTVISNKNTSNFLIYLLHLRGNGSLYISNNDI